MKRMTAEEVAEAFDDYADTAISEPKLTAAAAYLHAKNVIRERLIPHWQDAPDEESHAACEWWWCEVVPEVPQLLRYYRPLKINPEDSTFSVSMNEPLMWDRWTVSGWVPLVGRVCSIGERPS